MVYENDILQLIATVEGSIRFKPAAGNTPASLQFEYMLKDHLGNVRMVLTEEQQIDKYQVASLEDNKPATEQQYYDIPSGNIRNTVTNPISGLPTYTNAHDIGNNPFTWQ
jgi:hypothetical protein